MDVLDAFEAKQCIFFSKLHLHSVFAIPSDDLFNICLKTISSCLASFHGLIMTTGSDLIFHHLTGKFSTGDIA